MKSYQYYRHCGHSALNRVFAACLLLTLAVTLTYVEVGAAASGLSSIPEVKVYDQDVSTSVFNKIFGANWQNFAGQSGGGGTGPTLIFELLQTLNSVCAAAVSWLIIFTVLVGSVGAAHEGKSLAGRHSSPWVPIRFAFSFAAIAPVPVFKGLCAMQILILAGIGVSIDFANQMWTTGLEYVQQYGGITNESPPSAMLAGQRIAAGALRTSAMIHYMRDEQKCAFSKNETAVSQASWKEDNDKWTYQYAVPLTCSEYLKSPTNLKPGDMGGLVFTKTKLGTTDADKEKGREIDEVRKRAVAALAQSLEPTAKKLGNKTYTHDDMPAVFQAAEAYTSAINVGLRAQAAAEEGTRKRLKDFVDVAEKSGWLMAGSYYWILVNENAKIINALTDSMNYYPPSLRALLDARAVREEWTTYMEPNIEEIAASLTYSSFGDIGENGTTRSDMRSTAEAAAIKRTGSVVDQVTDSIGFIGEIPARLLAGLAKDNPDAILTYTKAARWIVGGIETAGIFVIAAKATAFGLKGVADGLWGKAAGFITGGGTDAVTSAAVSVAGDVLVIFLLIAVPLYLVFWTYAYILPAIPFLTWIAAVVGWIVLCVEAVIAAPLWLVGHALPEGDGFAGMGGRAGYMLFLSILLRPLLLVLSMFVCMILMSATGSLVYTLFIPYVNATGISVGSNFGVGSAVALLVILGTVLMILTWKMFELTTSMPDRIIRWVGQLLQNLGDEGHGMASQAMSGAQTHGQAMQSNIKVGWNKNAARRNAAAGGAKGQGRGGDGAGNEAQHAAQELTPRES
jgi:conjugal transfer/type IV secretion protein DotA/TraY